MNRPRQIIWFAALLALAGAWQTGLAAPSKEKLVLTDINGKNHTPFTSSKTKAVVFLFLLRDCPVSNVYSPEITRIHKEYSRKGVSLYLVHPDRDTNAKAAKAHAIEYKLTAPLVLDHEHKLTHLAGVEVTPEAAVFDKKGHLVYRGRINNLYADFGKKRAKPTQHDLRESLDALLSGRPPVMRTTKAVGCYIDFSNDKKSNK
ncbi:MAG: redoxin domain-containing protein [Verrucomicrobia bacterium]|jgi:peroxiredoxin|nr:redoxin domain-containing protein [Verrucomicrobiota bacterium]